MKKLLLVLVGMALVNVAGANYVETFDTDNANWEYGYNVNFSVVLPATWNASSGNPDGHISGASADLWAVWTYDTAAYGDVTGLTLTVDTKVTDAESGLAQPYVGRGGTYYVDGTWDIGADTAWTTHTVALSTFTLWGAGGNQSLAYVLAAPDDIGIFFNGNTATGTGDVLVDNFGVIPEPASMAMIGLVATGIYFKRRFFIV